MSIKEINLRLLETDEEVDTYCVLENETNIENATFNCYGYNDNINEENANNKITINNFTSEFVQLPENVSTTNKPENETDKAILYHRLFRNKTSKLPGGAIAAIVICCVAVLAIAIAMIIITRNKFNKQNDIEESQNNLKISEGNKYPY